MGLARWAAGRSLPAKLLFVFGLLLAIFIAGSGAALLALEESAEARLASQSARQVGAELDRLARDVFDQQLTLRGYVVTRRADMLDAHETARERFLARQKTLRSWLGDDALALTRLSQVTALMERYWETVADPIVNSADYATDRARAVAAITAGQDGRSLEEIRRVVEQMQETSEAELDRRMALADAASLRTRWILIGVLGGVVLLGAGALLFAQSQVSRPLEELAAAIKGFSQPATGAVVPGVDRRDELGFVARQIADYKRNADAGAQESWVKAGVAAVSAHLTVSRTHKEFAVGVLEEMCRLLGASRGRFLRSDGELMSPVAELGGEWTPEQRYRRVAKKLRIGEYVLGELEFARKEPLEPRHEKLLAEVVPIITLSWDNLMQHQRTEGLLSETQAQQSELRAAHEQLKSNARALEASEMALKAANEALREKSEVAHHQATHDPLTGVPNRLLFVDRLEQAMERCRRSGSILAICYIDIDGFKPVNDRHGHHAGDVLLRGIAQRLTESLRRSDTVARLGGDEFVLLMDEPESESLAIAAIDRLCRRIAEPYILNSPALAETLVVEIGASIGVAFFPVDARSEDALMQAADAAMYAAKKGGKNRVVRASDLGSRLQQV